MVTAVPQDINSALKDGLKKLTEIFDAETESDSANLKTLALQKIEEETLAGVSVQSIRSAECAAFSVPETFDYVRFPAGVDESIPSGVTVFFNKDGSLDSIVEHVVSRPKSGIVRLQVWKNRDLVIDFVVDEANERIFDGDAWESPQASSVTVQGLNWSKLNSCLASQGIPWTTVTLIGIGCAVACGATFGAGCVACLSAAGAISVATVEYCVRTSWE